MQRGRQIYEGKAKILYETDDPDLVIQYFKDEATAFNALKRGVIEGKGVLNNRISERLFLLLEGEGIPTHFIRHLSDREMLVKRLKIFPVEVIVRNLVAGSLAKRLGLEEGRTPPYPLVEFNYKNDALGDPLITEDHAVLLGAATPDQLQRMRAYALRVNDVLLKFFDERGLLLVDFKLEFGLHKGEILLGDEICPDTCRLWDKQTMEKLDKDRFRRDLGKVEEAYQEVCRRVCGE
ncbi:MAG: phosphoribosylaminoimidazolesuccinocarboxamide synthase [Nitrospirae bacterium]|nr:phosphoribosylaminoimidazolesuccinocarboxamide synthase [Nitrospirota bacterium]